MARIDLITAGAKIGWAVETTAGERPTSFEHLIGVETIPELNEAPDIIDTTTLDETTTRVGQPGLAALPSASSLVVNLTNVIDGQWKRVVEATKTAEAAGRRLWFAMTVPGLDEGYVYPCSVTTPGAPGVETGGKLSTNLYFTKTGDVERVAASALTFTEPTA